MGPEHRPGCDLSLPTAQGGVDKVGMGHFPLSSQTGRGGGEGEVPHDPRQHPALLSESTMFTNARALTKHKPRRIGPIFLFSPSRAGGPDADIFSMTGDNASLAGACLIFFFLRDPLGDLERKGLLGNPKTSPVGWGGGMGVWRGCSDVPNLSCLASPYRSSTWRD